MSVGLPGPSSLLRSVPRALKAVRCARRHPEQKKYMLSKEATFATSSSEGKGIRMIIDYLREEKPDAVRAILDEKPAFTTGMEKFEMDVHDQQLDYLSDDLGIKMNDSEDAVERYAVRIQTAPSRASWLGQQLACHVSSCCRAQPFGKVARACLDWAMRMEKEGKDKDYDLYETVRCLNC